MSSRSKMARSGWPKFLENMSCSFYIILSLKNRHFWTFSGLGAPPAQNDIPKRPPKQDLAKKETWREHEAATKCPWSGRFRTLQTASERFRTPQDASGRFRTLQDASGRRPAKLSLHAYAQAHAKAPDLESAHEFVFVDTVFELMLHEGSRTQ